MPGREEVIAAYHLHAAHCTEIAKRTSDLKRMAAARLTLAEQAEKNSLVYKTRVPIRQQQPGVVSKKQD